jgi:sugar/nucleoside kinase (ribokinase family)
MREARGARREARFDVVGVGANSIDFVCRLPFYPEPSGPNSKLGIRSYDKSPGGQTATVLSACASLGLRTSYIGTVARDENGAIILDALRQRGVDTARAIVREGANPFAVILVADEAAVHGERIVCGKRPDEMRLTAADLPPDAVSGARFLFVDDVDGDAAIAAGKAGDRRRHPRHDRHRGRETPHERADRRGDDSDLRRSRAPGADGRSGSEAGARLLRNRHGGLLCVTLGARGAAALDGDRYVYQPGFVVDAVDTTGAGDIFRAGFIYATLRGDATADVLRFACAAAAVSCTRRGAINSVPSLDDVNALLAAAPAVSAG